MIKKKIGLKDWSYTLRTAIYIFFFNKGFAYIQATVVFYVQCI